VIKGFTDNLPIGPELRQRLRSNVDLSTARAKAVPVYRVGQGVPAVLISTVGLGEAHPVASNDAPQGRARNRHMQIDIVEAPKWRALAAVSTGLGRNRSTCVPEGPDSGQAPVPTACPALYWPRAPPDRGGEPDPSLTK
jgi:OmpA family